MKKAFHTLACLLTLALTACADRVSEKAYLAAYDAGDRAFQHGTLAEAEAGQMAFLELSLRAESERARFVNARRTIWLASDRLYDIYITKGDTEKADEFLKMSYEYRLPEEGDPRFDEYVSHIREFLEALDAEIRPAWKTSNSERSTSP